MRTSLTLRLAAAALALPAFLTPLRAERPLSAQEEGRPLADLAQRHLANRVYELGLSRDHAFAVRHIHEDDLGAAHVRVDQFYKGVRVMDGEAILHLRNGEVHGMTDALSRRIQLGVEPSLKASEALASAHAAFAPKGAFARSPQAELVVARPGEGPRYALAYHVHLEVEQPGDTRHEDFLVDAHSGRILERWNTLHTAAASGSGRTQYNGTVTLNDNSVSGGYELRDMTRGSGGNTTRNLNHATSGTGTIYTDADNGWGDGANYVEGSSTTAANGQTAAVDAHYGLQKTWDMYKNVFGRNGIDGSGTGTYSRVHYSNSYDNAFWSDSCFCMTYGDGSSFKTLTALDVAGHEMSHGVCSRTANLKYSGESGGLNEANSDIMGTMAEFYARGGSGSSIGNSGGNWTIGEQLASSPLRWMYKPSLDGASPNFWSSSLGTLDVHYSSGVANHFFYLLSHGSSSSSPMANGVTSITGLGNDKAARIWYRALTVYMTSTTKYAGARTATLNAAKDLYGATSTEYNTVATAWKAVNVL